MRSSGRIRRVRGSRGARPRPNPRTASGHVFLAHHDISFRQTRARSASPRLGPWRTKPRITPVLRRKGGGALNPGDRPTPKPRARSRWRRPDIRLLSLSVYLSLPLFLDLWPFLSSFIYIFVIFFVYSSFSRSLFTSLSLFCLYDPFFI